MSASKSKAPPPNTIPNLALTLQMLEWIDSQPRSYRETMEAWHTHCPRFTIWEDAHSAGFVCIGPGSPPRPSMQVGLTASGQALLAAQCRCDAPV